MFGPPFAVVAAIRTVLAPAASGTRTAAVCQVVHAPVGPKVTVPAGVAPTTRSIGRAVVVPLAYRKTSVAVPAWVAVTVHSCALPTAFVVLQKPVPEKPAWF